MAKKAARKSAKPAVKAGKAVKKANPKKPARAGGSHVDFGLHGLSRIMHGIHEAGLSSELHGELDKLGHDNKFVRVPKASLDKLKEFVNSKEELKPLAADIGQCDCPPDDPYCIYI